jgi:hypothetical protein
MKLMKQMKRFLIILPVTLALKLTEQPGPSHTLRPSIDFRACSTCLTSPTKKYCVTNKQGDLAYFGSVVPPPAPISTQCCAIDDKTSDGCNDDLKTVTCSDTITR